MAEGRGGNTYTKSRFVWSRVSSACTAIVFHTGIRVRAVCLRLCECIRTVDDDDDVDDDHDDDDNDDDDGGYFTRAQEGE